MLPRNLTSSKCSSHCFHALREVSVTPVILTNYTLNKMPNLKLQFKLSSETCLLDIPLLPPTQHVQDRICYLPPSVFPLLDFQCQLIQLPKEVIHLLPLLSFLTFNHDSNFNSQLIHEQAPTSSPCIRVLQRKRSNSMYMAVCVHI